MGFSLSIVTDELSTGHGGLAGLNSWSSREPVPLAGGCRCCSRNTVLIEGCPSASTQIAVVELGSWVLAFEVERCQIFLVQLVVGLRNGHPRFGLDTQLVNVYWPVQANTYAIIVGIGLPVAFVILFLLLLQRINGISYQWLCLQIVCNAHQATLIRCHAMFFLLRCSGMVALTAESGW